MIVYVNMNVNVSLVSVNRVRVPRVIIRRIIVPVIRRIIRSVRIYPKHIVN